MDNRLYDIRGQRPSPLRRDDLPNLARAMVAVVRQRGTVGFASRGGTDVLVFRIQDEVHRGGEAVRTFLVLKSDWLRIYPFVQELFFEPQLYPTEARVGYLNPALARSEPLADRADAQTPASLYQRILDTLTPLFPEAFPTSNL